MAELKTKVSKASVDKLIKGIEDEQVRKDCIRIMEFMKKAAKTEPKM